MLYHGLTIANAVGQAALFSTSQISISTSCTRSIRLKLPHSPTLLQLITVDYSWSFGGSSWCPWRSSVAYHAFCIWGRSQGYELEVAALGMSRPCFARSLPHGKLDVPAGCGSVAVLLLVGGCRFAVVLCVFVGCSCFEWFWMVVLHCWWW